MSSRPASRPRSGSSSARRLPTPAAPTHGPPPTRRLARWTTVRTTRASPPTWGTFTRPATRPRPRAMVVAAVKRASRDAGTAAPIGTLTRRALEGFRRTDAVDAPSRRGLARGLTADECAIVLATCLRPRRTGRGLERPKTAERRGLVDGAIVALLFHGALRRSEVASLHWADVDFRDGNDVVVTVRRSKTDPTGGRADVRRLVGSCAAAVRSLHAAVSPDPGNAGYRPRRRPDQPPVRRRLPRGRSQGSEDLARRRPRRTRRRAHRPRGPRGSVAGRPVATARGPLRRPRPLSVGYAPSENAIWGNEVAAVAPDRSPGRNGLTQDDASAYGSTFLLGFLTSASRTTCAGPRGAPDPNGACSRTPPSRRRTAVATQRSPFLLSSPLSPVIASSTSPSRGASLPRQGRLPVVDLFRGRRALLPGMTPWLSTSFSRPGAGAWSIRTLVSRFSFARRAGQLSSACCRGAER